MKNSLLTLAVGKFSASATKYLETCMFIFGSVIYPKVNFDFQCLGFVILFFSLSDVFISKEWVQTSGLWKFPSFLLVLATDKI